jgi:hypothetical protein
MILIRVAVTVSLALHLLLLLLLLPTTQLTSISRNIPPSFTSCEQRRIIFMRTK